MPFQTDFFVPIVEEFSEPFSQSFIFLLLTTIHVKFEKGDNDIEATTHGSLQQFIFFLFQLELPFSFLKLIFIIENFNGML